MEEMINEKANSLFQNMQQEIYNITYEVVNGDVNLEAGAGIRIDGNVISVRPGGGLGIDIYGQVEFKIKRGLLVTGDGVEVRLAGSGLEYVGGGGLFIEVRRGNGITFASGVSVDAGDGLEFDTGTLLLALSDGLEFDTGDVKVKIDTDHFQFDTGTLQDKLDTCTP